MNRTSSSTAGTVRGTSPVVLTIARFVNLFLVALLAGLLVGVFIVERALLEVGPSVYTAVQKPKHEVFAPIMPVLDTLVIVSGLLVVLLLIHDESHRRQLVGDALRRARSVSRPAVRDRSGLEASQRTFR